MGIFRLVAVLGIVSLFALLGGQAGRHGAGLEIAAKGLDQRGVVETTSQAGEVETIAEGLDNPRGLAFGPKGALFVAEAGRGGPGPNLCKASPFGPGQICYGPTGAVTRIWRGEAERVVEALPSLAPPASGAMAIGPHDVSFRGHRGYIVTGLGAEPDARDDLEAVGGLFGHLWQFWPGLRRIADISGFEADQNPDGVVPPDSNPYSVLATHEGQYVADAGGNFLALVRRGEISLVAVFPARGTPPFQAVPTSIARGPGGDIFVGQLTGIPFPVGAANVYRVSRDGDVEVYASGFTNIIDIAFDRRGRLYVLEFATNGIPQGPPGALWRVPRGGGTKSESTQIQVEGLTLIAPGGLAIGHGAIYISNQSTSAGEGEVVRIRLNSHGDGKDDEDAEHDEHGDEYD
jgi:hypothetical protein